ncbi:MAG: tRNA (N(6)-L-threonylcarbamoyladenosine(37)-C(2))-methylthiotransferase MtaB [Bacilli bacterium]|nr:tRNA (N(6)-L-threonylcarbamoyladenosine(37)-C(2))-methylthiotransferase MtaB [Bacilli bacterium]
MNNNIKNNNNHNNIKFSYYSLGCKVNLYESEAISNELEDNGFIITDFNSICDCYIINTCSVTLTGDAKSRKIIREAIKRNDDALFVVMGCYAELIVEDIINIFNEYNRINNKNISCIITGTTNRNKLGKAIINYFDNNNSNRDEYKPMILHEDALLKESYEELKVKRFNEKTRGFVKIQDGCDNYCAYCTIPYARGHNRSRDINECVDEIKRLTISGMKEIVLTGINTGAYGLEKGLTLVDLLKEVVKIEGLGRIRISSIEQTEVSEELIKFMYEHKNHFCLHFHMPLQGGSDNTLKRMKRKYDIKGYLDKVNLIRLYFPDINITSDILTGFSGESNEDFEESLKLIDSINFGEIHVFPYSRRPRTVAWEFKNQVNDIVKKYRVKMLLDLNNKKALEYRQRFEGKVLEVIVERCKNGYCYGHSSNYIEIKFKGDKKSNDLVMVRMTKALYPESIGELI